MQPSLKRRQRLIGGETGTRRRTPEIGEKSNALVRFRQIGRLSILLHFQDARAVP